MLKPWIYIRWILCNREMDFFDKVICGECNQITLSYSKLLHLTIKPYSCYRRYNKTQVKYIPGIVNKVQWISLNDELFIYYSAQQDRLCSSNSLQ